VLLAAGHPRSSTKTDRIVNSAQTVNGVCKYMRQRINAWMENENRMSIPVSKLGHPKSRYEMSSQGFGLTTGELRFMPFNKRRKGYQKSLLSSPPNKDYIRNENKARPTRRAY
jgi:hypothetical protein